MRGDNSINTSSLADKERGAKGLRNKKKNGQIFEPKMFGLPLYLCTAVPSTPIKRRLKWTSIRNAQEKTNENEEKETERRKKCGIKSQKKKKKKKKIFMRI